MHVYVEKKDVLFIRLRKNCLNSDKCLFYFNKEDKKILNPYDWVCLHYLDSPWNRFVFLINLIFKSNCSEDFVSSC